MSDASRACRVFLLLAVLMVLPNVAGGQNRAPKVDEAAVRAKLLSGTYIEARLTEVDAEGAERKFTVEYVQQTKKAKPAGQAKYTEAARRYNAALTVQSTALATIKELYAQVKEAEKDAYDLDQGSGGGQAGPRLRGQVESEGRRRQERGHGLSHHHDRAGAEAGTGRQRLPTGAAEVALPTTDVNNVHWPTRHIYPSERNGSPTCREPKSRIS
jgi:hypothetical protein